MCATPTKKATLKAIISEQHRGDCFEIPVSCVTNLSVEVMDFSRNCTRKRREGMLARISFLTSKTALYTRLASCALLEPSSILDALNGLQQAQLAADFHRQRQHRKQPAGGPPVLSVRRINFG